MPCSERPPRESSRIRSIGLLLGVVSAAVLAGCPGSKSGEDPPRPTPPALTTVFVSPDGDDSASGASGQPRKTFEGALEIASATTIVVAPGRYEEDEVVIDRGVVITATGATLAGKLIVRGAAARVRGLSVEESAAIEDATGVVLEEMKIFAASAVDAITIRGSVARLSSIELTCGSETCARASGSTVAISNARLIGENVPRGVLIETSSAAIDGIEGSGSSTALIQAADRSFLRLARASLSSPRASGVVCVGGSRIDLDQVTVREARNTGVLLSSCDGRAARVTISMMNGDGTGVGIEGGTLSLRELEISAAGARAGIIINNHRTKNADVTIEGGRVEHGVKMGLNVGQGRVTVRGTRFIGAVSAAGGEDAISASGQTAELHVDGAEIDLAAGFAVGFYNNAFGSLRAVITRPQSGGVIIESAAGAELVIRGTTVRDPARGSGIIVQNALDVRIEDVEVVNAREAGLLAGERSQIVLDRGRFTGNRQYGIAAFGGSEITVSNTSARKSKWATFATCADGARIIDEGGNTFDGASTTCP